MSERARMPVHDESGPARRHRVDASGLRESGEGDAIGLTPREKGDE